MEIGNYLDGRTAEELRQLLQHVGEQVPEELESLNLGERHAVALVEAVTEIDKDESTDIDRQRMKDWLFSRGPMSQVAIFDAAFQVEKRVVSGVSGTLGDHCRAVGLIH